MSALQSSKLPIPTSDVPDHLRGFVRGQWYEVEVCGDRWCFWVERALGRLELRPVALAYIDPHEVGCYEVGDIDSVRKVTAAQALRG